MSAEAVPAILCIGVEEQMTRFLDGFLSTTEIMAINTADEFAGTYETWNDGKFVAILCGPAIEGVPPLELAQVLMNQCPQTPRVFAAFDFSRYEPRLLVKNGFDGVYRLPADGFIFKNWMAAKLRTKGMRVYKAVQVADLGLGDAFEFDVYAFLPLNKKYVKISKANHAFERNKIEKISEQSVSTLYIDSDDASKFFKYAADRLRSLGQDGATSATERKEMLSGAIRSLVSDLLDSSIESGIGSGRELRETCEKVISNYITKGSSEQWLARLMSALGSENDGYDHAGNVSTFAALFGIGLGHSNPEDLAMAGLFHDLGLEQIPEAILTKPESSWTQEERDLYYSHAEKSVFLVKSKRLALPPAVEKAIMQHHESHHGKGYPKALPGFKISEEAQILSLADQFDELTRFREGQIRLAPAAALDEIAKTKTVAPDLIRRVRDLVVREPASQKKTG